MRYAALADCWCGGPKRPAFRRALFRSTAVLGLNEPHSDRRQMHKKIILGSILAICAPFSAQAEAPMVGSINAGAPACFARAYSAEHMANHPRQKVTDIAVTYRPLRAFDGMEPEQQWDENGGEPIIYATIAVKVKGVSETLLGAVVCGHAAGRLECGLDEDAGTFTLTQSDAGMRLENQGRIMVVPATSNMGLDEDRTVTIDARDDHSLFILPAASGGLCDVRWPTQTF